MMPFWAEEAYTPGLGPRLAILPFLGLLLAFGACLISVCCRLVHRHSADTPPFLRAWVIPDQSARKLLLKISELLPGCQRFRKMSPLDQTLQNRSRTLV